MPPGPAGTENMICFCTGIPFDCRRSLVDCSQRRKNERTGRDPCFHCHVGGNDAGVKIFPTPRWTCRVGEKHIFITVRQRRILSRSGQARQISPDSIFLAYAAMPYALGRSYLDSSKASSMASRKWRNDSPPLLHRSAKPTALCQSKNTSGILNRISPPSPIASIP